MVPRSRKWLISHFLLLFDVHHDLSRFLLPFVSLFRGMSFEDRTFVHVSIFFLLRVVHLDLSLRDTTNLSKNAVSFTRGEADDSALCDRKCLGKDRHYYKWDH